MTTRPTYDLVLTGGTLVDPSTGLHAKRNLAVTGQTISAILDPDDTISAQRVLDVSGLLVVPGFIDLHVHVFSAVSHYGVDVDSTCLARGVTTALDAGSSGAFTFPGFRKYILDVSATRVLALLNISAIGMVTGAETDPPLGELEELRYCDVGAATRIIEANRDRILGIKIRLSDNLAAGGANELPALLRAREAADAVGLPIMIHTPQSSLSIDRILAELRPGDVLTHCFHEHRCGIFDADRNVLPAVRAKVEEGLLLDVGHGRGSLTFDCAGAALEQGVLPHTISSDLHRYNLHGPVFDLVTTINKFLALGVSLNEALLRVTATPARFLGMEGRIGTLSPGAGADLVVLERHEGDYELADAFDRTMVGHVRLEPRYVFRAGRQVGVLPKPD